MIQKNVLRYLMTFCERMPNESQVKNNFSSLFLILYALKNIYLYWTVFKRINILA